MGTLVAGLAERDWDAARGGEALDARARRRRRGLHPLERARLRCPAARRRRRARRRGPGGATPSSTRSIPAPSRTPTATGSATWPGSPRGSTTCAWLGVDALWLSPIYPSPMADIGLRRQRLHGVDPVYGALEDFDRLVAEAKRRGLRLLMDLVPSHTSIEHPWFREHPDWYVWADGSGDEPPNNWRATFGGPAWSRDPRDPDGGRWYLHSFFPEQPDLDWRNPEVRAAFAERGPLLARPRRRRLPRRRDRADHEGRRAARRPARHRRAAAAAAPRAGGARHGPLPQRPRDRARAGGAARGRGRGAPGRRGLPAERDAAALPRAPRPRLRLRVPARALERARAGRGDRRGVCAGAGRLGALQPRLPPPRHPPRRGRRAAPRRCCC